jgi:hypothetical protein
MTNQNLCSAGGTRCLSYMVRQCLKNVINSTVSHPFFSLFKTSKDILSQCRVGNMLVVNF